MQPIDGLQFPVVAQKQVFHKAIALTVKPQIKPSNQL